MVNCEGNFLERRNVVKKILSDSSDSLVVSGLGSPTYDVHAAGDNDRNFYLWGGMGGAAMMGLGLALAQPEKKVIVITGDGEQLMGLGSLATISVQKPKNLLVIVLDNERFGETGMQESHTSKGVDLAEIALASGCSQVRKVRTEKDLEAFLKINQTLSCFTFAVIKVSASVTKRSIPIVDGTKIKTRFRRSIGLK
mgnify:CR=1 FL=1